jgi:SMI1 / KNR4 family (SUKH-1)
LQEKGGCMDTTFKRMFERIQEKCQGDGWYGGKLDLRHARSDHPQRHGFAYPPAGEEQLRATETALGFLLPPVLRALYAEVANGGFGPGGGIQGVLGGYGSRTDEPARTIVDDYHWHCQIGYTEGGHHGPVRLIDLANVAGQGKRGSGKEDLLLPHEVWPEQLLLFEDLGCCMEACLDCKTGHVLCIAPSGNDEEYEIGPIAPSLEEYLERWLRDEVVP